MADASPVNRYLLFNTSDEFCTGNKVLYSLLNDACVFDDVGPKRPSVSFPTSFTTGLDRRMLVRTLDELKRNIQGCDRGSFVTPSTNNTFATSASRSESSPESHLSPSGIDLRERDVISFVPDDASDLDATPWDSPDAQANVWNWPIEVLYQQYNLVVAIDFSESMFGISRNGVVFVDRIPSVLQAILQVIETTLETRDKEAGEIEAWLEANVSEAAMRTRILQQVWRPEVLVTLLLLNVPKSAAETATSVSSSAEEESNSGAARCCSDNDQVDGAECSDHRVRLFPSECAYFSGFDTTEGTQDQASCSAVPLIASCNARQLLHDATFTDRLHETLLAYENLYRSKSTSEWPKTSLGCSIEYLLRNVPENPQSCPSIVLITNAGDHGCSESIFFFESAVRRKNIIFSLLSLNRLHLFDSLNFSPLAQFLADIGGFAVHVDYWLALAARRTNVEWCRRFAGGRCLSQQLLVQLVSHFPVHTPGLAHRVRLPPEVQAAAFIHLEKEMPDQVLMCSTRNILRAIAEARYNEGWSVVMDYAGEDKPAHLVAKYQHSFYRGTLILHYEMDVNPPVVYRRLLVTGTESLADFFVRMEFDERLLGTLTEPGGSWDIYFTLLRSFVYRWIKSEHVILKFLAMGQQPSCFCTVPELAQLTSMEGVSAEWLSHGSIASLGVFIHFDRQPLHLLLSMVTFLSASGTTDAASKAASLSTDATSILPAGKAAIRHAMLKSHIPVGKDSDMAFIGFDDPHCHVYLVQFFPFRSVIDSSEVWLADGFECRLTCILSDSVSQRKIVNNLVATLASPRDKSPVHPHLHSDATVMVDASSTLTNRQALLVCLTASGNAATRRMALLSTYTENNATLTHSATIRPRTKGERPSPAKLAALQRTTLCSWLHHALVTPCATSSWSLNNALCFHWELRCSEAYPLFATAAFGYAVMRRLLAGFRMLQCCSTTLYAVMIAENFKSAGEALTVFDVITAKEMPSLSDQHVTIRRVVTPYARASRHPLRECTYDVQDDIRTSTALHTYNVFSSMQSAERASQVLLHEFHQRGAVIIRARIESLLPYLHSDHTEILELKSPPSLGAKGAEDLRRKLLKLVNAVGDRCVLVAASALQPSYAEVLSSAPDSKFLEQQPRIVVAIISPIRYQTITFLLMLQEDSAAGKETGRLRVAIASLDGSLLQYGLSSQYGLDSVRHSTAHESKRAPPECLPDNAVVASLRHLLESFTSVYSTKQLMDALRTSLAHRAPTASIATDIFETFSSLGAFSADIDASHLLFVVRRTCHGATGLEVALNSVMTELAQAAHILGLPEHPSLLFLYDGAREPDGAAEAIEVTSTPPLRPDKGDLRGGRSAHAALSSLAFPVLVKLNAMVHPECIQADSESGLCFWVRGAADGASRVACMRCSGSDARQSSSPDGNSCFHWSDAWADSPTDSSSLRLHLFIKTVPAELLDVCLASFEPSAVVVRQVLRSFIYKYTSCEAGTTTRVASPFEQSAALVDLFTNENMDREAVWRAFQVCKESSAPPGPVDRFMKSLVDRLTVCIATYCLRSTFSAVAFSDLRELVNGRPVTVDSRGTPVCQHSSSPLALPSSGGDSVQFTGSELGQTDLAIPQRVRDIVGLQALLHQVVVPALLSASVFETARFPIHFTQQTMKDCNVDPIKAVQNVFQRCVTEDHMCIIPITNFSFVFIANARYFARRWVMVDVEFHAGRDGHQGRILCYDADECTRSDVQFLSNKLLSHISTKITQISQLHLLKQLRDTQYASAELIPPNWGDQLRTQTGSVGVPGVEGVLSSISGTPDATGTHPLSSFYLQGRNVLQIPIYYKLQHQFRKILSHIASNSSRLELITIFNHAQCFVVADGEERDVFHYLRLVFVKDTSRSPSVTNSSPLLLATDRCPKLVVQLFSATFKASINRPLQKLQDFCYFLAVQELQGHLNYVQHKMISTNDLVFLQNQRLDPIVIDLDRLLPRSIGVGGSDDDARLALSMLFVNLREHKFKPFGAQEEISHAASNFVEHYHLEEGITLETPSFNPLSCSGSPLRFVKLVDGLTDVLASCALRCDANEGGRKVIVERFLTKIPENSYANGESEVSILAQLSSLVEDTVVQLSFYALSQKFATMNVTSLASSLKELLHLGQRVVSHESSMLRHQIMSLDGVSPALYPHLVQRLCGTLSSFGPCCFEGMAGELTVQHVRGFPWRWVEGMQNHPLADQVHVYIVCGYRIVTTNDEDREQVCESTLIAPYSLVDLPISVVPAEESLRGTLKEYGFDVRTNAHARIILSLSLLDGLSVVLFNLRDADLLLRTFGQVVRDMEERSSLLGNILLQRLGYGMLSPFSEADLARCCCGDDTNIIGSKRLSIRTDVYRRRVNYARFRAHPDSTDDPLIILTEGLYNRGYIINYMFCREDAVKVLHDECPHFFIAECENIVDELILRGSIVRASDSHLQPQWENLRRGGSERGSVPNYRLACTDNIPADALIACVYQRHITASHIIVEAQNARSGMVELLSRCDVLWRAGPQSSVLELAKCIVMLQQKSKEVFGSRVPDFFLHRERWSPGDVILEQNLPSLAEQDIHYSDTVNSTLQAYMNHLQCMYPSMCVIDLDPLDPITASDAILLSRLRCRYGKFVTDAGEVVRFTPHLYYAVIPFVDLLRCSQVYQRYGDVLERFDGDPLVTPITTTGLFIVGIGLQVAHYALDFYVINGAEVPLGVMSHVAAEFKQSLLFSSVLYDVAVKQTMLSIRSRSERVMEKPSQLNSISTAIAYLIKYYPSPPVDSINIVAAYSITDPRITRLEKLSSASAQEGSQLRHIDGGAMYLVPQKDSTVDRARTHEVYLYCGIIVWETKQLFVLLVSLKDFRNCQRCPNDDLSIVIANARNKLLHQLLDSTQQERLDDAWVKFLSYPCGNDAFLSLEQPTYDEFELLRGNARQVRLPPYRSLLQARIATAPVEWVNESGPLIQVQRVLLPHHTLHVLVRRQRGATRSVTLGAVAAPTDNCRSVTQDGSTGEPDKSDGMERCGDIECAVFTFAPPAEGSFLLAVQCTVSSTSSITFTVKDVTLFRKTDAHGGVPSVRRTARHTTVTTLTPQEQLLLDDFLLLLTNALWADIVPYCVPYDME